MKSRDFCYWLQGYFEIHETRTPGYAHISDALTPERIECIKRHLAMVFKHEIDPSFGDAQKQQELTTIHQDPLHDNNALIKC